MATIRDLAAMTGLSLGTISNYLNGKTIKPQNAEKLKAAIQESNYFPNNLGKYLRSGDTKTIGIIANDIAAPYISKSVSMLQKELSIRKYKILFCNSNSEFALEKSNLNFLISQNVSAIIIFPISFPDIENIQRADIPFVICDSMPLQINASCYTINYDNNELSFRLTELLIKQGHRHIACIAGTKEHYSSISRIEGYQRALKKNHLPVIEDRIFFGNFNNQCSYEITNRILDQYPEITACLLTSNNMLIGHLLALEKHGRTVGRDFSYVTFSHEPYYDLLPVAPTYVLHHYDALGRNILKVIEGLLLNNREELPPFINLISDSEIILGASHQFRP